MQASVIRVWRVGGVEVRVTAVEPIGDRRLWYAMLSMLSRRP